jgi:hypothetical protein
LLHSDTAFLGVTATKYLFQIGQHQWYTIYSLPGLPLTLCSTDAITALRTFLKSSFTGCPLSLHNPSVFEVEERWCRASVIIFWTSEQESGCGWLAQMQRIQAE